ncbi:hypothetical protein SAMD00079811_00420 [Scytonema sp. HK-05]|nr:hypothetical protein SAMD00079811_00420 [Scytonema sp. HK-05]
MMGASNPLPIASHQIKDYGGGLRLLLLSGRADDSCIQEKG